MIFHRLKTIQPYFGQIVNNSKTFEVRRNDRNFKEGDYLRLDEWSNENGYSGNYVICVINILLDDINYCKEGYVIMSISVLSVNFDKII